MERKDISALIFTLVISSVLVPESHAYCWQAGWNPGFKGPPTVHQVKIDKVRVSWKDIVKNRECADQFLVKYWPRNQPMQYQTTDLVMTSDDSIDITVTPKITYQFQAVAREDKGVIGGIDWNKSPTVEFKTSTSNRDVAPEYNRPAEPVRKEESGDPDYLNDISGDDDDDVEDELTFAGMSVEILVIVVIAGLLVLLIAVGVVYKLVCGRKKNLYDDEEDDDDEDDSDDDIEKKGADRADDDDGGEGESLSPEKNVA